MFISTRKIKNPKTKEISKIYYLFYRHPITNVWTKVSTGVRVGSENDKKRVDEFSEKYQNLAIKNNAFVENHSHDVSFKHFQEQVLEYLYKNTRYKNYLFYRDVFKKFNDFINDDSIKLEDITSKNIEAYKDKRLQLVRGVTVHAELRTIRSAFNIALDRFEDSLAKHIKRNPVTKIIMTGEWKNDKKEFAVLSREDEKRVMEATTDNFQDIFTVAIKSGIRPSELLNLKWENLDFQRKIIHIRDYEEEKQKVKEINKNILSNSTEKFPKLENAFKLKTKLSKRSLPMNEEIYKRLLARKNRLGNVINLNKYVFTNPQGMPYAVDYISGEFKKICKKLNLDSNLHFYSLRHTYATRLSENGIDIKTIQTHLGHSDIYTTANIYIHQDVEAGRNAANFA